MKHHRFALAVLLLLECLAWLTPVASAQGTLTLTPNQLTIAGTRCYSASLSVWFKLLLPGGLGCTDSQTRTLLLASSQPITQAQVIALDLTRGDGVTIIPASAMQVNVLSTVQGSTPVTIPVTVDFRDAPSGEFKGNLVLHYYAGSQSIPVTVTVKDPWLLPLLVLLLGVALGIGVGAYRAGGQKRDQLRVSEGQLRASMTADPQLPASFRDRLNGYLAQVDIALQGDKLEDAGAALKNANALWEKWQSSRADWIAQLTYQTTLAKRCEGNGDLAKPIPYAQSLCRAIGDAGRTAPDLDAPTPLRKTLDELTNKINLYLNLQAALDYMRNRANQLSDANTLQDWKHKIDAWQARLDLQAVDKPDTALEGEIKSERAALDKQVETQLRPSGVGKPGAVGAPRPDLLPGAPASLREPTLDQQAADAQRRIRLFTLLSYVIAIVLLAGAGFTELYINKATFGASPWGDYFGLFAWGFGAEATRQAVTGVLKTWNLAGVT